MVAMCFRLLLVLGIAAMFALSTPVRVTSPLGTIIGKQKSGVNVFLGIPYAKSPERWTDPMYPETFDEDYVADSLKSMCMQNRCNDKLLCINSTSGDCLYMNIFAPANVCQTNPKAVMFYIHGGSFVSSTGLAPVHFGDTLADQGDVIVVTINYRLPSVFRWLATWSSGADISENYGIKDQRMALRWVNENIAAFGGDPNKVTLFGDSAGAQSVAIHQTNRKSDAFFSSSILMSPSFTIPFKSYDSAHFQAEVIAQIVGCSINDSGVMISCLLQAQSISIAAGIQISPSELVNVNEPIGPVIDKDWVPASLIDAFEKNMQNMEKPVMLGTVKEEAVLFLLGKDTVAVPYIKVQSIIRDILMNRIDRPPTTRELVKNYPLSHPNNTFDAREEFAQITTDYIFTCPTRKVAGYTERRKGMSWLYLFNETMSSGELLKASPQCVDRVCHGVELAFVFNVFQLLDLHYSPEEVKLAETIVGYFSNFAKYGNPNNVDLPKWRRYRSRRHMIFRGDTPTMGSVGDVQGKQCRLWDSIGYYDYTPIQKKSRRQL